MSYEILRRELKQGVARGLYLFYGPEEYLKRHYTGELEKLIVEPIAKDVSYNAYDSKSDLGAIYEACTAYPLFGGRRLVVLKNCGFIKQSGGGRKRGANAPAAENDMDAALTEQPPNAKKRNIGAIRSLSAIVDTLPEFTCLLIIEDEVDKRLSLFKQIGEKGLIVEFAYRSPAELEDWARAVAGQNGKKFTREALKHLVAFTNGSMTDLRSELEKLLMYTEDKPGITLHDVNAICALSLKVKIFGLLDSVLAGNKRHAFKELDLLLREREPAMRIISAISNHFVLLRQIKGLAGGGVKLSEAAKLMGINPYRAEILWRQSARVDSDSIERAIARCYERDMDVKSGVIADVNALRLLIMSITV